MKCCVCDEELPCATTWAVARESVPKYELECIAPGCTNRRHARGLCTVHYGRWHYRVILGRSAR